MKFFIPLGFRYKKETPDVYSSLEGTRVFGPYGGDEAVEAGIQRYLKKQGQQYGDFLIFDGQAVSIMQG